MKKTILACSLAASALFAVTGCRTDVDPVAPGSSSESSAVAQPSISRQAPAKSSRPAKDTELVSISRTALADLDDLQVKGRAPKTGYSRDAFGQSWSDDVSVTYGHNGCDTRNDILKRDLTAIKYKGSSKCVIASGTLADPYTGTTIDFVRGNKTSTKVQIDHVVALSDAWQKGAQQLSAEQRRNLANDPRNLMAVDGPTNGAKSDGDAATWLPPNKSYRCTYVAKQITVKKIYGLWVTPAEKAAMTGLLEGCAK